MVEFLLVAPLVLLMMFIIIEAGRLLFAWMAIENGARFGLRYAQTGEFDPAFDDQTICDNFYAQFGETCDTQDARENAARILSIHDAVRAGSMAIQRDEAQPWTDPGFYDITICSNRPVPGFVYTPPDPDNWSTDWSADCSPYHDAGAPGSRMVITVDFNHPLFMPFLASEWPHLHLTASREGRIEQFRVSRIVGVDPTLVLPSPTPLPSNTPTNTPIPSPTPSPTTTPCKVPPAITIEDPPNGATYNDGDQIPSWATAYDPDNVDPVSCTGVGSDGEGINRIEFRFQYWDGASWGTVFSSTESASAYCGFGGNGPCSTINVSDGSWPSGVIMSPGEHRMLARARDDEGVYSGWHSVTFYLNPLPTPTPTITPTPSCTGVDFGSFHFDQWAMIRQEINNTTYPGLEVTGVTVYWGPLEEGSDSYGWNERVDFMEWDGTRIRDSNDYSSSTSSNKNTPRSADVGTHTIRVDWDGGFNGYLNSSPANLSSSNFGFSVTFSDSNCNLYRSASGHTWPTVTPTYTPTATSPPTNTPPPSNTPTPSDTPTITPTPSRTPSPTRTPTASNTPPATATPTASNTSPPTNTPLPSDTPEATATPTATETPPVFD